MDPNAPSSSTAHRASSGVHPRRSASTASFPRLARQLRCLAESCIRPIRVDPEADVAAGVPDLDDPFPPTRGHTLPDIRVEMPDLLSSDLSHHPSAYLHANEVYGRFTCFLGHSR